MQVRNVLPTLTLIPEGKYALNVSGFCDCIIRLVQEICVLQELQRLVLTLFGPIHNFLLLFSEISPQLAIGTPHHILC